MQVQEALLTSGSTKLLGIIGWPVEHSLSPFMHNLSFQTLGLDYHYVPLPVKPQYLPQAINSLRTFGFVGANVTIPYKVSIMTYLDSLDKSAQEVGAVNTIVFVDGRSVGYNTDAEGFMHSLCQVHAEVADKQAVVLGAGGAARAIVAGLLRYGAAKIIIGARESRKAQALAEIMVENCQAVNKLNYYNWQSPEFYQEVRSCQILINATPLGMWPKVLEGPPINWKEVSSKVVVCDVVYNPLCTSFLQKGLAKGCKTVDGLGMLIKQGRLAFKLWTGIEVPNFEIKPELFAAINKINEKNDKYGYK